MSQETLPDQPVQPLAPTVPKSPYQGLMPYSEDDAAFFFGRESEREIIVANLLASRLTLLYGPSGVGKSSVLHAGVARRLRQMSAESVKRHRGPEFAVAVFSLWRDDPLVGLAACIRESVDVALGAGQRNGPPMASRITTDLLESWTKEIDGELLVILDQFEEYFLYHGSEDSEGSFAIEFPRILKRDDLRVNFLLAIREDALAKLDRFEGRVSNLFDNYIRLEHLDREAARAAILEPVLQYNRLVDSPRRVSVEPELVEALLDQVKTGEVMIGDTGRGIVGDGVASPVDRIETPYLQLVLTRLWAEEMQAGSNLLRLETLESLGGAERIVRTHLDQAMAALPADEQEIAARAFHHLVTPTGTKIAHTGVDLAEYAKVPKRQLIDVLEELSSSDVRILRPIAAPAGDTGGSRYEIFHDVLAAPVLDWRQRHVDAQERAEAERQLATSLERQARQKREEEERARKRHRQQVVRAAAMTLAMVLVILTVLAFVSGRNQRDLERNARLVAEANNELGVDPGHSVHLGLAAVGQRRTPEAEDALRRAVSASRLRAVMRGHSGWVQSAVFSPDSRIVLTGGTDGTARLWNLTTGREVRTFGNRSEQVTRAEFSRDGTLVVTGSSDGTARVWDVRTGTQRASLAGDGSEQFHATFSPDAQAVLTWRPGGRARVWEWTTGRNVALGGRGVQGAAFSPDGGLVVTGSSDGRLRLWGWRTSGPPIVSPRAKSGTYVAIPAFSPDGKLVAAIDGYRDILTWRWKKHEDLHRIDTFFNHEASSLEFSRDGRFLVATGDKAARVYKVDTGEYWAALLGHKDWVKKASFSPDGRLIVTVSGDGSARIWDTVSWQTLAELRGHAETVTDAAFSPDSRFLVTASADETARVWVTTTGTVLKGNDWLLAAAFSPDGRFVATVSGRNLLVWELGRGAQTLVSEHLAFPQSVAFSPDGRFLVTTGAYEQAPRVWDWRARRETRPALEQIPYAWMRAATFSPDGQHVVAGGSEKAAYVWDIATGKRSMTFSGHDRRGVLTAEFSPDGKRVLTAGEDNTAHIWDAETGRELLTLRGHAGIVYSARFSHDGRLIVTASGDRTARIWDAANGRQLRTLTGPQDKLWHAAFSPDRDNRLVVAGGAAPDTYVWEAATGRLMAVMRQHTDSINTAVFSPDGRDVLTSSDDYTARIYPCETCGSLQSLLALANDRASHT
jgi:WD40 repeat protein